MKNVYLTAIFTAALLLSACGGGTDQTNVNAANSANAVNANRPTANTNNGPLAAATATPAATTNNAPTLSPVYKAYCSAWEKKDEKVVRAVYSSDTIQEFEKDMKDQGIRSLAEYLSNDQASTDLCEARNEKISGDTATAEVRTKGYPNGITVVFVKENGEWKLTNRFPEGALK